MNDPDRRARIDAENAVMDAIIRDMDRRGRLAYIGSAWPLPKLVHPNIRINWTHYERVRDARGDRGLR